MPHLNRAQVDADRALLATTYPACFAPKGGAKRPLKIGIHADLAAAGLLPRQRIVAALRDYTWGPRYHEAIVAGGPRFDLAGQPSGEVTPAQVENSRETLARIKRGAEMAAERERLRAVNGELLAALRTVATAPYDDDGKTAAILLTNSQIAEIKATLAKAEAGR